MNHDHYQILGIGSTASQDEIKRAYRRLVKMHHPDVSRDPRAAAKTRLINAAYRVLSDPAKRLVYDHELRRNGDSASPDSETASVWIYCQGCGLSNETLRVVGFYAVVGFLLGTWRTVRGGVLCGDCRSKLAFRQNLVTAIFGWWGVPCFFYAWHALVKNLTGGVQPREANEELRRFIEQHKGLWASQVAAARTRPFTRFMRLSLPMTLSFGAMALLCSWPLGSTPQADQTRASSSHRSPTARGLQQESTALEIMRARLEADIGHFDIQVERLDSLDAVIEGLMIGYMRNATNESLLAQLDTLVNDRDAKFQALTLQASALDERREAFNRRATAHNERLVAAKEK